MRLVERMTLSPTTCVVCGAGNVPDKDGQIGPFLDIERDVDWGDSVYFCPTCLMTLCTVAGFASPDEVAGFKREIRDLEKKLHDTESELEQRSRRADRAEKELKIVSKGEKIKKRVAAA